MSDRNAGDPPPPLTTLYAQSMPPAVALVPAVFERPDVRRACIPGVGGIFTARDEARFWALLAEGGELDGVRLLSAERVAAFSTVRDNGDELDPVMFGVPIPISIGGYWLGELQRVVNAGDEPATIGRPLTDPSRVDAIAAGRARPVVDNVLATRRSLDALRAYLAGLSETDWQRIGRHVSAGDMRITEQLDTFHIGHVEQHLAQLDDLVRS